MLQVSQRDGYTTVTTTLRKSPAEVPSECQAPSTFLNTLLALLIAILLPVALPINRRVKPIHSMLNRYSCKHAPLETSISFPLTPSPPQIHRPTRPPIPRVPAAAHLGWLAVWPKHHPVTSAQCCPHPGSCPHTQPGDCPGDKAQASSQHFPQRVASGSCIAGCVKLKVRAHLPWDWHRHAALTLNRCACSGQQRRVVQDTAKAGPI